MCRYLAYVGEPLVLENLIYRPENSLIHQASEAMESPTRINADGFGIGWYSPEVSDEPAVFKDITPAWNNANLRSLAGKVSSGCILAHVRAAARNDPISRANCHPFQHRRLLWMHNGDIPGRGRLHRHVTERADDALVARIAGNTDTELAFILFLSFLGRPLSREVDVEEMADAMERTIQQLAEWQVRAGDGRFLALNFCVTNGAELLASRYASGDGTIPSLHWCRGRRFVCDDGRCRLEDPGPDPHCVIVASEILTEEAHWETVEPDSLLLVHRDLRVARRPLLRRGALA